MSINEPHYTDPFSPKMIAPCGVYCGLCVAHLREKNPCPGCKGDDAFKPKHCVVCRIKNCDETVNRNLQFCFECSRFPCARLRNLDKRYWTKYQLNLIQGLESIRDLGLSEFANREKFRWICPECGRDLCIHSQTCI